jgi:hypothetical protein
MLADRTTRDASSRHSDAPARDSEVSSRRDLVPVTAAPAKPGLAPRSRLTDTLFVAHLFATRFKEPQTRDKRRAEPGEANASYRKAARRPAAPTGRVVSKKI